MLLRDGKLPLVFQGTRLRAGSQLDQGTAVPTGQRASGGKS